MAQCAHSIAPGSQFWIQGSCVTRDALQHRIDSIQITRYRARSSVISLMSDPVAIPALDPSGTNRFEHQNVLADFSKSWLAELMALSGQSAIFDFIDERFGIIDCGFRFVTYSTSLRAVLPETEIRKLGTFVHPASEQYATLMRESLGRFIDVIAGRDNIWIHEAYWAESFEDGRSYDAILGNLVAPMNSLLEMIYTELRAAGVRHFGLPRSAYRAAVEHRWRVAPFHYSERTEEAIGAMIIDLPKPHGFRIPP